MRNDSCNAEARRVGSRAQDANGRRDGSKTPGGRGHVSVQLTIAYL